MTTKMSPAGKLRQKIGDHGGSQHVRVFRENGLTIVINERPSASEDWIQIYRSDDRKACAVKSGSMEKRRAP
jgi:hypothetical protein